MRSRRRRAAGFSLIELLVAIFFFGVVAMAVGGVLVSGTQTRRDSLLEIQAHQFAFDLLERHKDYWTVAENYELKDNDQANAGSVVPPYVRAGGGLAAGVPSGIGGVDVSYSCLGADGTDLSDATGPLYCSVADPQLRRVTVTLTDLTGAVRSRLVTEVGRPYLRGSP